MPFPSSPDRAASIWRDCRSGSGPARNPAIRSPSPSPDGSSLLTFETGKPTTIDVRNIVAGTRTLALSHPTQALFSARFSPDARQLRPATRAARLTSEAVAAAGVAPPAGWRACADQESAPRRG